MHFASTDRTGTLPADLLLTSGVGTFTATLNTAGSQNIEGSNPADWFVTGNRTITVNAATATHFKVTTAGATGTGAPFNFTVTALDNQGNTVTGYTGTVHFASSDSGATLPANHSLTNGKGTFSATLATSGTQTITATDVTTSSVTGSCDALAATHLGISGPGSAAAGSGSGFTITALDAYNSTVTGFVDNVQFTSSDSLAGMPSGKAQLVSGVGVFSAGFLTTGSQSLTVTDTSSTTTNGTTSVTVTSPGLDHFALNATVPTATAGVATIFTITAQDQFANSVGSGYTGTIHFTSSDTAAALPADATLVSGTGVFSATLNTAGDQSIYVSDPASTSTVGAASLTVNPQISHFAITAPSTKTAGSAFAITITAEDSSNATVTGYTGIAYFSSSDDQAVLPGLCTLTSGVGIFTATLKTAGSQSIYGNDMVIGPSSTGTTTVTVIPASINHFVVARPLTPQTAGVALSFTVTAKDAYNNTITGYTGTTHFTSSDWLAVLPGNHTLTSGIGTFSATLKIGGSQSIIATDTGSTATASSGSVTINPNIAAAFSVGGGPNPTTAGAQMTFDVYATDAYGNHTSAYSGTVTVSSSDAGAILPANFYLATGHGTFSATLTTAGTRSITVKDTQSSMTGTQGSITVNPGADANRL